MHPLKAITLWQPWATLLVAGIKKVETRSWSANYRGVRTPTKILIHAATRAVKQAELDKIYSDLDPTICPNLSLTDYPKGCILGLVVLDRCEHMTSSLIANTQPTEKALGLWQPGRWAWYSSNFQLFDSPIKCRGKQLFWTPEPKVLDLVQQQLEVKNVA